MATYPAAQNETGMLSSMVGPTPSLAPKALPQNSSTTQTDDRLNVGLGASLNNSKGRPFNPDLTDWMGQ